MSDKREKKEIILTELSKDDSDKVVGGRLGHADLANLLPNTRDYRRMPTVLGLTPIIKHQMSGPRDYRR
jgi:hypothetical protein